MTSDPSEADIAQVVDVAAVDRETACRYLKVSHGRIESHLSV